MSPSRVFLIVLIIGILGFMAGHHIASFNQVPKNYTPDIFTKEYQDFIATESSKKTVDFIVNKMITDKRINVNKDGSSYLFTLTNSTIQK